MENLSSEIQALLSERLGEFKAVVVAVMKKAITDKGLVASGDLLNSIYATLAKEFGGQIDMMLSFSFNDSGRFAEMKKLNMSGLPPVGLMEKWVERRGISSFRYVPGYGNKSPLDRQKAIRRLAWAIAFNRKYNNMKGSNRVWTKFFFQRLNVTVVQIADDFAKLTGKVLKTDLQFASAARA